MHLAFLRNSLLPWSGPFTAVVIMRLGVLTPPLPFFLNFSVPARLSLSLLRSTFVSEGASSGDLRSSSLFRAMDPFFLPAPCRLPSIWFACF